MKNDEDLRNRTVFGYLGPSIPQLEVHAKNDRIEWDCKKISIISILISKFRSWYQNRPFDHSSISRFGLSLNLIIQFGYSVLKICIRSALTKSRNNSYSSIVLWKNSGLKLWQRILTIPRFKNCTAILLYRIKNYFRILTV